MTAPDAIDRMLLDGWQRDFPLDSRPYARLAGLVGVSEAEVLERFAALREGGAVSRIGAVVRPHTAGCSTLAAVEVPAASVQRVGEAIAALPAVNHCYEREHRLNIWFVVAADDETGVAATLAAAEAIAGAPVLDLRLQTEFRIDLGFPLQWS